MLRILTVVAAVLGAATFAAAENLKSATLLDGKVVISLPESFVAMTEEMKRFKYPTGTPPDLVFTDEAASVNVALRVVAAPAKSGDMGAMASAIAEQISKVRNIPTWHGKGARTIGGREFGYLEFTSAALDTNVYNYMYFTVMMANCSCSP